MERPEFILPKSLQCVTDDTKIETDSGSLKLFEDIAQSTIQHGDSFEEDGVLYYVKTVGDNLVCSVEYADETGDTLIILTKIGSHSGKPTDQITVRYLPDSESRGSCIEVYRRGWDAKHHGLGDEFDVARHTYNNAPSMKDLRQAKEAVNLLAAGFKKQRIA